MSGRSRVGERMKCRSGRAIRFASPCRLERPKARQKATLKGRLSSFSSSVPAEGAAY
jgi:hypothetical protein